MAFGENQLSETNLRDFTVRIIECVGVGFDFVFYFDFDIFIWSDLFPEAQLIEVAPYFLG